MRKGLVAGVDSEAVGVWHRVFGGWWIAVIVGSLAASGDLEWPHSWGLLLVHLWEHGW